MASEIKLIRRQGKSLGIADGLPAATDRRAVGLLNAEGRGAQLNAEVSERGHTSAVAGYLSLRSRQPRGHSLLAAGEPGPN